jgi:asparagine synthase (glutamine-hydrolysing)
MAHGVEGRHPFLDHRVFDLSVRLAAHDKLCGLREKVALRALAREVLPPAVAARGKQPYRAPELAPFLGEGAPAWVDELLSPAAVRATGLLDERRLAGLLRRCRSGRVTGYRETMALVAALSTQAWYEQLVAPAAGRYQPACEEPRVVLDLAAPPPVPVPA